MYPVTFLVILVTCILGPSSALARPNNEDKMPEPCETMDYCFIKHDNYPQKHIDEILKKSKTDLWFEDDTNIFEPRDGSSDNDCKVNITTEPIYEIIDKNGKMRYVVQSDKRFKQILRVEECVDTGRLMMRTEHFSPSDLKSHVVTCEERNITFNFLVLTPDFKRVELAQARYGIPVCCACVYHGS